MIRTSEWTTRAVGEYLSTTDRLALTQTCRTMRAVAPLYTFAKTVGCAPFINPAHRLSAFSFVPLAANQGWIAAIFTLKSRPLDAHRHQEQVQILLPLEGQLIAQADGTEVLLNPSDWVQILPGVVHTARSVGASSTFISINLPGKPYPQDVLTDKPLPEGITRIASSPSTSFYYDAIDGLPAAAKAVLSSALPPLDARYYTKIDSTAECTSYAITATRQWRLDMLDIGTMRGSPSKKAQVFVTVNGQLTLTLLSAAYTLSPGQSFRIPPGQEYSLAGAPLGRVLRVTFL